MKKFLNHLFLFIFVFIGINLIPNLFLKPYYGNEGYLEKYNYFISHQTDFNTIVFGSSRMYRHIDPSIFDKILADYQTSTFNMAAPAITNPEIYYLYEKLLEEIKLGSLKYAIVELQPLWDIERRNINTVRNYYWLNLEYLYFSVRYAFASDYPLNKKIGMSWEYAQSYLFRLLNSYKSLLLDKPQKQRSLLGVNNNGYYSLDDNMNDIGGNNGYKKRLEAFLKDTSKLEERETIAQKTFGAKQDEHPVNQIHFKKILDLIEKSEEKGVQLIFNIGPRHDDYSELLAIKSNLHRNRVVEVADPNKFPELYLVKCSFDYLHLNKTGAEEFTNYLAYVLKGGALTLQN